jgi:NCS1 family nucleobase:cation symporter-1
LSTDSSASIPSPVGQQALAGRIPIAYANRIFSGYGEFFLTCTTLGAASYAYLFGVQLIAVGTTWLGMLGYTLGMIIGGAFVSFSVGSMSYRFGVDIVDASKPALGMRGSVVVLIGVILVCGGWGDVLLAMTARGTIDLFSGQQALAGFGVERLVVIAGFLLIALVWVLLSRGAKMMERAASYGAIVQVVVALIVIALVAWKFDLLKIFLTNVDPQKAYTPNRHVQLAYAVEFGVANGLTLVPFFGGLARLVKHKRHLVGPVVTGCCILGCAVVSAAGAMASIASGKDSLGGLLFGVGGQTVGAILLAVVLIANIGTMVTQFYVVGLALQQITLFARLRWEIVAAAVVLPGVAAVLNTQWLLDHVITFVAYSGVLFVGVAAVLFVDFFVLRRQHIVVEYLFAKSPRGPYWFVAGVNWVAIFVIGLSMVIYLYFFDPVTLRIAGPFRFLGASVPTLAISGVVYYVLMKLFVMRGAKGGYRSIDPGTVPLEVGL